MQVNNPAAHLNSDRFVAGVPPRYLCAIGVKQSGRCVRAKRSDDTIQKRANVREAIRRRPEDDAVRDRLPRAWSPTRACSFGKRHGLIIDQQKLLSSASNEIGSVAQPWTVARLDAGGADQGVVAPAWLGPRIKRGCVRADATGPEESERVINASIPPSCRRVRYRTSFYRINSVENA